MTRDEWVSGVAEEADKGCASYYDVIPSLIRTRGYEYGIEIGVFVGGHAEAILKNSDLKLLIGIDPYVMYDQPMQRITSQEDFDCVYEFAMNRLKSERYFHIKMTSNQAYEGFLESNNFFDFVFIDGLHTYKQVKWELDNYSKLIRKGGVIACHDYKHTSFPDLTAAIDEFAQQHNTEVVLCPFHAVYIEKTW